MRSFSDSLGDLGGLHDDVIAWLDWQQTQFMRLAVESLTQAEAREYTGDGSADAGLYWRLSAPGYLDATDWAGPFSTLGDAVRDAYRAHGDEMPFDE